MDMAEMSMFSETADSPYLAVIGNNNTDSLFTASHMVWLSVVYSAIGDLGLQVNCPILLFTISEVIAEITFSEMITELTRMASKLIAELPISRLIAVLTTSKMIAEPEPTFSTMLLFVCTYARAIAVLTSLLQE